MRSRLAWLLYSLIVAGIISLCWYLLVLNTPLGAFTWLVLGVVFLIVLFSNPATIFRRAYATLLAFYVSTWVLAAAGVLDSVVTPEHVLWPIVKVLVAIASLSESKGLFAVVFGIATLAALIEMLASHDVILQRLFRRPGLRISRSRPDQWSIRRVTHIDGKEYLRVMFYANLANQSDAEIKIPWKDIKLSFPFIHLSASEIDKRDVPSAEGQALIANQNDIPIEGKKALTSVNFQLYFSSAIVEWVLRHLRWFPLMVDLTFQDSNGVSHSISGRVRRTPTMDT